MSDRNNTRADMSYVRNYARKYLIARIKFHGTDGPNLDCWDNPDGLAKRNAGGTTCLTRQGDIRGNFSLEKDNFDDEL